MVNRKRQADEIEITDEMVKAGSDAICEECWDDGFLTDSRVAARACLAAALALVDDTTLRRLRGGRKAQKPSVRPASPR